MYLGKSSPVHALLLRSGGESRQGDSGEILGWKTEPKKSIPRTSKVVLADS
jgi:hypothetical protein